MRLEGVGGADVTHVFQGGSQSPDERRALQRTQERSEFREQLRGFGDRLTSRGDRPQRLDPRGAQMCQHRREPDRQGRHADKEQQQRGDFHGMQVQYRVRSGDVIQPACIAA